MACENDVIVLMQRKNKLLIDPIFETKRRPALRGLLYAPDDKLQSRKQTILAPACYVMQRGSLSIATCMLTK